MNIFKWFSLSTIQIKVTLLSTCYYFKFLSKRDAEIPSKPHEKTDKVKEAAS